MKTVPTSIKIHQLITQYQQSVLIPRPEFQRRHVWNKSDKIKFIETILKGYPFPEIYLADGDVNLETGLGTQLLVDGQQRVTAIVEYFRGEIGLRVDSTILPYDKLPKEAKESFMQYDVAVRNLGNAPSGEIIEVFRRINLTNYSLTEMEINNAIYSGQFKTLADRLAALDFFHEHKFFRPMQIRRMGDTNYVVSLLATMMSDYFNRDDRIEEYLQKYDDEFESADVWATRFIGVTKFIEKMKLPQDSRIWKQSDFYTAFVEIDRLLHDKKVELQAAESARNLTKFYEIVDADPEDQPMWAFSYHRAAVQAANDRANRALRGELVNAVLTGADLGTRGVDS